MSEDQLTETFDDNAPEVEALEPHDDDQPKGYMDKEAWVAAGKDPDEWVSPEVYKERGIRIEDNRKLRKEMARQQQETEARIANLNKLHRIQLDQERNKLLLDRDNAIDIADKNEVRRIDQALKNNETMQSELAEPQVQVPPEIKEWEVENPWVFDKTDPRTGPARYAFAQARADGKSLTACIIAADRAAAKVQTEEPKIRRTPMAAADNPKARQSSGGKIQLTMSDLTSEERHLRSFYNSEADFLKAVADSRKG